MFQPIYYFDPLRDRTGRVFRPRAYGRLEPDATWSGYLVFFSATEDTAIATPQETTQRSSEALTAWAVGLTRDDLHQALERALQLDAASEGGKLREMERPARNPAPEAENGLAAMVARREAEDAAEGQEIVAPHHRREYTERVAPRAVANDEPASRAGSNKPKTFES